MHELNSARLAVARSLVIDHAAAEAVTALRHAGIEAVLLKGATLARWLYPQEVRPYGDADLLVAPRHVLAAADVLAGLGYQPFGQHVSPHAHPWIRHDGAEIDLHARLFGLRCSPERAWDELQNWIEPMELLATRAYALNIPARALQVVLHAVQHVDQPKPREDLRRALAAAAEQDWRGTEILAERLDALHIIAHGLSLEPAGSALVQRLPLIRAAWLSDQLNAPLAVGFTRLAQAPGLRAKLAVLRAELTTLEAESDVVPVGASRPPRSRLRRQIAHMLALLTRTPRTFLALRRARSARGGP